MQSLSNSYLGHSSVNPGIQKHSMSEHYARFGLICVIHCLPNGRKVYQAERNGRVVATSWHSEDSAMAAAEAKIIAGVH